MREGEREGERGRERERERERGGEREGRQGQGDGEREREREREEEKSNSSFSLEAAPRLFSPYVHLRIARKGKALAGQFVWAGMKHFAWSTLLFLVDL